MQRRRVSQCDLPTNSMGDCMSAALKLVSLGLGVLALTGCASLSRIENPSAAPYAPEREPSSSLPARLKTRETSWAGASPACSIFDRPSDDREHTASFKGSTTYHSARKFPTTLRLSRGDVVNVLLPDGDEFNGDYTIGPDGKITLPFVRRISAASATEDELARRIHRSLVANNLFSRELARVAVRVVRYAAVRVRVRGAVFQPGLHTVNEPRGEKEEAELVRSGGKIRRYGDFTIRRTLTAALRIAAGVRPDADISRIVVVRRGKAYRFDLRGVITGHYMMDPALEDNDEIIVSSKHCFQAELVRPSSITPRGIRIYVSKIHFAADSRYDEKIPYGLRLLKAAVVASCIGGPKPTRGHREIVLVSKNPLTGATEVVQRSVETLLREKHRDSINPFLMPDDGVACYDSPVREAADIASVIQTLMSPFKTYNDIRVGNTD